MLSHVILTGKLDMCTLYWAEVKCRLFDSNNYIYRNSADWELLISCLDYTLRSYQIGWLKKKEQTHMFFESIATSKKKNWDYAQAAGKMWSESTQMTEWIMVNVKYQRTGNSRHFLDLTIKLCEIFSNFLLQYGLNLNSHNR